MLKHNAIRAKTSLQQSLKTFGNDDADEGGFKGVMPALPMFNKKSYSGRNVDPNRHETATYQW